MCSWKPYESCSQIWPQEMLALPGDEKKKLPAVPETLIEDVCTAVEAIGDVCTVGPASAPGTVTSGATAASNVTGSITASTRRATIPAAICVTSSTPNYDEATETLAV